MAKILGKKKRNVNQKKNATKVCCTSRQVSGKGCIGCPFLNNGCVQPPRIHSAGLLMPKVKLKQQPNSNPN